MGVLTSGGVVNTLINILLIPIHGLLGASLATLITHLGIYFALVYIMRIKQNRVFYQKLITIIVSGTVFLIPYFAIAQNSLIIVLTSIAIGSILYVFLIINFKIVRLESISSIFKFNKAND